MYAAAGTRHFPHCGINKQILILIPHSVSECCSSHHGLWWETLDRTVGGVGHQLRPDGVLLRRLQEQSEDRDQIEGAADPKLCLNSWGVVNVSLCPAGSQESFHRSGFEKFAVGNSRSMRPLRRRRR